MAKVQTGKVEGTATRRNRLVKIELDEVVIPRRSAEAEHERAIAIYDILRLLHELHQLFQYLIVLKLKVSNNLYQDCPLKLFLMASKV